MKAYLLAFPVLACLFAAPASARQPSPLDILRNNLRCMQAERDRVAVNHFAARVIQMADVSWPTRDLPTYMARQGFELLVVHLTRELHRKIDARYDCIR